MTKSEENYRHPYDRQGKNKKAFYIERRILDYLRERIGDRYKEEINGKSKNSESE